ncbi:hypothetical protein [Xenorhabdus bovienii]
MAYPPEMMTDNVMGQVIRSDSHAGHNVRAQDCNQINVVSDKFDN